MKKQSWLNPKTEVKRSFTDRKGVFVKSPIKRGEIIAVSGGIIISEKECKRLKKKQFKRIDEYSIMVSEGFYLITDKKGRLEKDDFFNHSCSPNAGVKERFILVAMRDIKQGEEITYDYAMTDAESEDYFKCNCGYKNCRREIRGSDWKKPELQKKYKGYFSWYVQQKINRQKSQN